MLAFFLFDADVSAPEPHALPLLVTALLLALPLLIQIASVFAVSASGTRSRHLLVANVQTGWPFALIFVAAFIVLLALSSHDRPSAMFFTLGVAALFGAIAVQLALRRLLTLITTEYLDPSSWRSAGDRGERWRFQMKQRFIDNPEYVDELVLTMIETHPTYTEFQLAADRHEFPPGFEHVLDRRYWGFGLPTVKRLATRVVPYEVLANRGPYTSGQSPDSVYGEIRDLLRTDKALAMDRWQYYWLLRNLNFITTIVNRALSPITHVVVVLLAAGAFVAVSVTSGEVLSIDLVLRAATVASLAWLLLVCAGTSLILVSVFRGTGTFEVALPPTSTTYDPIWAHFIQIGILVFVVSFVLYGIGMPLVLSPEVLHTLSAVDTRFLVDSSLTFLLCSLIFLNHALGTHTLMVDSKRNALARLGHRYEHATDRDEKNLYLQWFNDVRLLREWPFRGVILGQVAIGVLFPITVQAVILYSGLKRA